MTAIPTVKSFLTLATQPSWAELACLLVAAAVLAVLMRVIGDVIWRSMPADELRLRIAIKDGPRKDEADQIQWELRRKEVWSAQRITQPQMTRPIPLTIDQLAERRRRLAAIANASLGIRAAKYLLSCQLCQQTWVALVVLAILQPGHPADLIASTLVYAWITSRMAPKPKSEFKPHHPGEPQTGDCPGCQG